MTDPQALGAQATTGETGPTTDPADKQQEQTFTQADVDRIVKQRADRIAKERYADYDELKAKAEGAKTLEDRLADVEKRYAESERNALRSNIAAKFGIAPEDRDLFLTGADEAALTAQAERLAAREADRKKQGNVAPKEGNTTSQADEKAPLREFAKQLFDRPE
jgi:hypothetical protein